MGKLLNININSFDLTLGVLILLFLLSLIIEHKKYKISLVKIHSGFLVRHLKVKFEDTIFVELTQEEVDKGVDITISKAVAEKLDGCIIKLMYNEELINRAVVNKKDIDGGLLEIKFIHNK